ncbi:MAG TPA: DNA polymerase III subunit chi [Burkholderiales bacterium]|nr:DNA polymerase III subunit chi [Burkholderiales bacterium]
MTEVLFYTHVESKLQTACQLCAKALAKNMRVMILTPRAELTEKVSKMLWSVPSIGFYPHCRASDKLSAVTPIIVDHLTEPLVHDQVLINLRDETPPIFSRFRRLIEIVSLEEADRSAARERFRFYRDRGYEITTHPLGARQA